MNLEKSYEFFKPESVKCRINIIGCGSVGSTVAENLARCGIREIALFDFDIVEDKNIVNQMFTTKHVGMSKVDALEQILLDINPDIQITKYPKGWVGQKLSGIIILCVDSIEIRRQIVEKHMDSEFVRAILDFRTTLKSAQHYAANWASYKEREILLNSMQFSHEEASEETPMSACGGILGVATTVRAISALGVNNLINFINGGRLKRAIFHDAFDFTLDAFNGA